MRSAVFTLVLVLVGPAWAWSQSCPCVCACGPGCGCLPPAGVSVEHCTPAALLADYRQTQQQLTACCQRVQFARPWEREQLFEQSFRLRLRLRLLIRAQPSLELFDDGGGWGGGGWGGWQQPLPLPYGGGGWGGGFDYRGWGGGGWGGLYGGGGFPCPSCPDGGLGVQPLGQPAAPPQTAPPATGPGAPLPPLGTQGTAGGPTGYQRYAGRYPWQR